ncbi:hypothetical protein HF325_001930 [Metschnikowia pulcherrima]|uniref:Uncharacterized protein n=1 Tax=Metschnikowia pulcherrima TaxID=27326 RepID=A0A8H7LGX3_9ASCO|nr:hypothetical protein HF325_001930 [Metschnikowia pulcherrima]
MSENAQPNNQEGIGTQLSRQTKPLTGRNRPRKANRDRNKNGANDVDNKEENGSKSKTRKPHKARGESKDFRLLEVVKLIRKHFPITVNGYSVTKVLESQATLENIKSSKAEGGEIARPVQLSKKAKESILVEHIENVIKRDPQQPIYLSFIMKPADPDFPFELELLNFSLTVPSEYPRSAKALPSIVVLNTEIPRGFSVNIERGYREIVNLAKGAKNVATEDEEIKLVDGKGLLSQVQTLNKYLELFLQQEKKQTMKFVTFKSSPRNTTLPTPAQTPTPTPRPQEKLDLAAVAFEDQVNVTDATRLKREFYIGEMTQKLGSNVKLFNRSKAEARYKVQIPIVNSLNLPHLWTHGNNKVDVFVTIPNSYPETPVRVMIASNFSSNLLVAKKNALVNEGHDLISLVDESRAAEKNFNKNVNVKSNEKISSLVQHLNCISNQLHLLVCPSDQFSESVTQLISLRPNDIDN